MKGEKKKMKGEKKKSVFSIENTQQKFNEIKTQLDILLQNKEKDNEILPENAETTTQQKAPSDLKQKKLDDAAEKYKKEIMSILCGGDNFKQLQLLQKEQEKLFEQKDELCFIFDRHNRDLPEELKNTKSINEKNNNIDKIIDNIKNNLYKVQIHELKSSIDKMENNIDSADLKSQLKSAQKEYDKEKEEVKTESNKLFEEILSKIKKSLNNTDKNSNISNANPNNTDKNSNISNANSNNTYEDFEFSNENVIQYMFNNYVVSKLTKQHKNITISSEMEKNANKDWFEIPLLEQDQDPKGYKVEYQYAYIDKIEKDLQKIQNFVKNNLKVKQNISYTINKDKKEIIQLFDENDNITKNQEGQIALCKAILTLKEEDIDQIDQRKQLEQIKKYANKIIEYYNALPLLNKCEDINNKNTEKTILERFMDGVKAFEVDNDKIRDEMIECIGSFVNNFKLDTATKEISMQIGHLSKKNLKLLNTSYNFPQQHQKLVKQIGNLSPETSINDIAEIKKQVSDLIYSTAVSVNNINDDQYKELSKLSEISINIKAFEDLQKEQSKYNSIVRELNEMKKQKFSNSISFPKDLQNDITNSITMYNNTDMETISSKIKKDVDLLKVMLGVKKQLPEYYNLIQRISNINKQIAQTKIKYKNLMNKIRAKLGYRCNQFLGNILHDANKKSSDIETEVFTEKQNILPVIELENLKELEIKQ